MVLTKLIILCVAHIGAVSSHRPDHDHTEDCRKAESLFYSLCSPDPITLRTFQGPAGKRGAPGPKGDVGIGIQGPPGIADYTRVDSEMDRKLEEVSSAQDQKIAQLEAKIRALEQKEGLCHVKYDGKCFWAEMNYAQVRQNQIARMCSSRGGSPANIYSEEHYRLITNYLRTQMLSDQILLSVWLGMRFDTRTMTATLSDGSRAPFLKWHEGYPRSTSGWVYIATQVRVPWNRNAQNMHNYGASQNRQGVLCEKE